MDWLALHPEALVDRADPSDLLPAVREAEPLTPEQASRLDFAFRQWVMRAISRRDDTEGLLELDDLIYLAGERMPAGGPDLDQMRARWQGFRDLLESKRLAMAGAGAGKASRLVHTKKIEGLLSGGPMTQSELRQALGLSAARVSQILGVLEEADVIRRERRGKENIVALADADRREHATSGEELGTAARHYLLRQLAA